MDFWTIVDHRHGTPTVKPIADFQPRLDAEALRKAMKGFGTDEETLINILCYRSNFQRLEIAKMFKTMYGRDLDKDIKSETSGNFKELLVALLARPTEYYAQQLHKAVKGLGTDEKCLIEIMCSLNNQQIRNVREAYEELFKSTLEEDLVDDTSGYFRRLLRSLCTARRNESREIDVEAAKVDAERLNEAGELHLGTDEAVFNEILASRSYPQLLQIFTEYETLTGNTMEKAIENEFSGSIKGALLAIVQCARSKIDFYAERLYKSMKGLGTDDKALIRLVVTHCEVDMVEIKESFLSHYEETLETFIEDDTSGDYRKALIALVKDEDD